MTPYAELKRSVYRDYGLLDASQPQVLSDAPQWLWSYSEATAQRFVEARREAGRRLVNSPWMLPGEFARRSHRTYRGDAAREQVTHDRTTHESRGAGNHDASHGRIITHVAHPWSNVESRRS